MVKIEVLLNKHIVLCVKVNMWLLYTAHIFSPKTNLSDSPNIPIHMKTSSTSLLCSVYKPM